MRHRNRDATSASHCATRRPAMALFRFGHVLVLLLAILAPGLASAGKDYYRILGVDRGADDRTLKKAYRNLALCVSLECPLFSLSRVDRSFPSSVRPSIDRPAPLAAAPPRPRSSRAHARLLPSRPSPTPPRRLAGSITPTRADRRKSSRRSRRHTTSSRTRRNARSTTRTARKASSSTRPAARQQHEQSRRSPAPRGSSTAPRRRRTGACL